MPDWRLVDYTLVIMQADVTCGADMTRVHTIACHAARWAHKKLVYKLKVSFAERKHPKSIFPRKANPDWTRQTGPNDKLKAAREAVCDVISESCTSRCLLDLQLGMHRLVIIPGHVPV